MTDDHVKVLKSHKTDHPGCYVALLVLTFAAGLFVGWWM